MIGLTAPHAFGPHVGNRAERRVVGEQPDTVGRGEALLAHGLAIISKIVEFRAALAARVVLRQEGQLNAPPPHLPAAMRLA